MIEGKGGPQMKLIHAVALGAALISVASIQIAVLSPAYAVEPEGKGSKSKTKKAASKPRQHTTTPRAGQPRAPDPQERKSYGY
jgi:hypothetical protein